MGVRGSAMHANQRVMQSDGGSRRIGLVAATYAALRRGAGCPALTLQFKQRTRVSSPEEGCDQANVAGRSRILGANRRR